MDKKKIEIKNKTNKNIDDFHWKIIKEQLNPHFLFNSLNILKSLISIDKEKAIQYTVDLAELLRLSIDNQESEQSISKELHLLKLYISLQNQRFGSNILTNIHIKNEFKEFKIPFLSLIILVENAIKHNVISNNKKLFIHLYIDDKYICLKNNLNLKYRQNNRKGLGLKNIKDRLKLFTKKKLIIEKNLENFCVKLPYHD